MESETKTVVDLLSKAVSEQNSEVRHCETLSASLIVFSVLSLTTIVIAVFSGLKLTWDAIRVIMLPLLNLGAILGILGAMLTRSRKTAVRKATIALKMMLEIMPESEKYLIEITQKNLLVTDSESRYVLPWVVFLIGMVFTLAFTYLNFKVVSHPSTFQIK